MNTSATLQRQLSTTTKTWLSVSVLLVAWFSLTENSYATDYTQIDYLYQTSRLTQADVPGTLVDIGTHRLHIDCQGNSKPTIIVDTGLGAISLEWKHIQKVVAKHARICLYDRAGYGYSDPGPLPRTSSFIVDELYKLLIQTGLEGPFILAGHSFGGYNMQLFARRYPNASAGVILVDSSHVDQYARFLAPPIGVKTAPPNRKKLGIVSFTIPHLHPNLPIEVREDVLTLMLKQPMRYAMAYEFYNYRQSAEEVKHGGEFPDIPLFVLSRGKRVYPHNPKGDLMESLWMQLQSELTHLSHFSAHVVANRSGHFIHLDQPQLVIDSIALLVDVVRYQHVQRDDPVAMAVALEPTWYDFIGATWRSNRLYSDPMLGHIYPNQVSQNRHIEPYDALMLSGFTGNSGP